MIERFATRVETGLDDSTVLASLEGEASNFVIINHARWDGSLVSVLAVAVGEEKLPVLRPGQS